MKKRNISSFDEHLEVLNLRKMNRSSYLGGLNHIITLLIKGELESSFNDRFNCIEFKYYYGDREVMKPSINALSELTIADIITCIFNSKLLKFHNFNFHNFNKLIKSDVLKDGISWINEYSSKIDTITDFYGNIIIRTLNNDFEQEIMFTTLNNSTYYATPLEALLSYYTKEHLKSIMALINTKEQAMFKNTFEFDGKQHTAVVINQKKSESEKVEVKS